MARKRKNRIIHILLLIALVFSGLILIGGFWVAGSYNTLVYLDETANSAWGNVETAYQRRADLIPNLVSTVKASAEFEQSLLNAVTQARAGISSASSPEELDNAGAELDRLINVVFENYPQIRSTEGYLSLQDELSGTENRIKRERDLYNEAVARLNVKVRRFPTNMLANLFNIESREYFKAEPGADEAPDVDQLI